MNAVSALLRLLLRPDIAPWEPFSDALADAARAEHVAGACAEHHPACRAVAREQAARALALPRQLAELDELLDEPAVLLKGTAFSFDLYAADPGARLLSDIDLLLTPPAAERLRRRLRGQGWRMLDEYPNYFYLPDDALRLPLDLHTELICTDRLSARASLNTAPGAAQLLAQRQPLPGYRRLQVLTPPAQGMAMLMHHLLHHGARGVKWWLDFHRWWLQYPAARTTLLTAAPPAWRPALAFGIWLYQRLAGVMLPATLAESVAHEYRAFWPWYATRIFAHERETPLRYLAAFAWLPSADWPRYLRELVLPAPAALRAYYGISAPAAALYLRHWSGHARRIMAGIYRS